MSECSHECSSCGEKCQERDLRAPANAASHIKKVIGVISGKGGVGKSTVTSLLAVAMSRAGCKVAVLDSDLTGPCIPQAFGAHEQVMGNGVSILPLKSKSGVELISINLFLEHEDDPVVWRGPVITGTIKQFWSEVEWGDVDYMFVDMPPGTGDVALTVFQSLPVDGLVVVATPQQLVSMIVGKAVNMAAMMKIPVLALVENMSGFRCPDCGKVHDVFGPSSAEDVAARYEIPLAVRLPMDPALATACDEGKVEDVPDEKLAPLAELVAQLKASLDSAE